MNYSILYRGPLRLCNYMCDYCPFLHQLKKIEFTKYNTNRVSYDKKRLTLFFNWLEDQILEEQDEISIFFVPAGEILNLDYYINMIKKLINKQKIKKVVVQTNLSFSFSDIYHIISPKFELWITYHPEKIKLNEFITKVNKLFRYNVKFSIGVVGLKKHITKIEKLRKKLRNDIYLWINAIKYPLEYYSVDEIEEISKIDPYFIYEINYNKSYNESCESGRSVFFIDERANIRRCILDNTILGNIKSSQLKEISSPISCKRQFCNCFIGYIHLESLNISDFFIDGKLARIPNNYRFNKAFSP